MAADGPSSAGAPLAVLALVLVPFALDLVASFLNRSWLSRPIPEELAGIYDAEEYTTSQRYNREKSTLGLLGELVEMGAFLAFWLLGGFPFLDRLVMQLGMGPMSTGVLYILVLALASQAMGLPFSIYSTFVLEARYGFNRTTVATYVKDILKALVLILVLAVPLLIAVLGFFMHCGELAWLYTWVTFATFQLVLFFLAPVLILPLFLEMIPLPEGLAVAVDGVDKDGPWVFLRRIFYEVEGGHGGAKAYETRDRQFAGTPGQSKLSLWCDESGFWKITEGSPQGSGSVYASSCAPASSPEEASWRLHALEGASMQSSESSSQQHLLAPGDGTTVLTLKRHDVGTLRRDLLALAERLQYTCDKIYIIDGSTRSEHSNAFCTGFGRFRRICLFDTLLSQLSPDEIVAVLGHEIGHDKLHHVKIGLLQTLALLFVEFFLLGQFISNPVLAQAFYLPEPKVYTGFVIFGIVWGTVESFISIPLTVQSRCHEHQADRFSIDAHERHAEWLADGLKKMMRHSKANLTPHPLKVFLEHSHPPLLARIRHIREHHTRQWGSRLRS
uniref:Ste24 endopeptidase n=1 Tax=Alexandrium monilatum TaxID=311494 RepID=A0A7S4ULG3_9DINO